MAVQTSFDRVAHVWARYDDEPDSMTLQVASLASLAAKDTNAIVLEVFNDQKCDVRTIVFTKGIVGGDFGNDFESRYAKYHRDLFGFDPDHPAGSIGCLNFNEVSNKEVRRKCQDG